MSESLGCHTVCLFFVSFSTLKLWQYLKVVVKKALFFFVAVAVVGESEIHPESSVSQADPEF